MTRSPLFLATLIALGLSLSATDGHAELSASEAVQLEKLRGVPVVSLDGALVGTIDGASVKGDRASIFVRPSQGSLFRLRGKDVIIRTPTSEITLQANAIVLNADAQRIKIKATKIKKDDDMIDIVLPRR